MTNPIQESFERNGYVVLTGALPQAQCKELTDYMFELFKKGLLEKDPQCPLSDSIYGDKVFDDLLAKFAAPIGKQIGRELLPTYTYARIYRNGEILKKHKDRPSCEISATMTLGFKSKSVWPIFFDEESETLVDIQVGEMAVYKGCEVLHWRPKFKGEWQVQVFFHYVDANGPYKDFIWDKRGSIEKNNRSSKSKAVSKNNQQSSVSQKPNSTVDGGFILHGNTSIIRSEKERVCPAYTCVSQDNYPNLAFTKKECDAILKLKETIYETNAAVGSTKASSKIDKQIRSAKIYGIDNTEETRWIFDKILKVVSFVNESYYDYELIGILHSLQLIEYSTESEVPGHYDWHVDIGMGDAASRKLSVTVQLNDPNEYTGCNLVINNIGVVIEAERTQGSINIFPSYCLHKVEPITSGVRHALVIWIHGSRRFR